MARLFDRLNCCPSSKRSRFDIPTVEKAHVSFRLMPLEPDDDFSHFQRVENCHSVSTSGPSLSTIEPSTSRKHRVSPVFNPNFFLTSIGTVIGRAQSFLTVPAKSLPHRVLLLFFRLIASWTPCLDGNSITYWC